MDADRYQAFTQHLIDFAEGNDAVDGLVAVGSMAGAGRQPDEWSDHDFWMIMSDPAPFRSDQSWLPEADRIVLAYAETEHGTNVIYDDGHLIEYATFAPEDLRLVHANDYRMLVDKGGIADQLAAVVERTEDRAHPDDATVFGRFIGQLVIGLGRHGRGEVLSAQSMVGKWAMENLLVLLARRVEPEADHPLDSLDPRRRFDFAYPTLAARLTAVAVSPTPEAARTMVAVAAEHLADVPGNTPEVRRAIEALIGRVSADPASRGKDGRRGR